MSRLLTAALVASTVVACGGGGGDSHWAGTTTDSAGVKVVANPAEGMWGPDQGWRLDEELRIGALDGKPEYQFGQITAISSDSHHNLYVYDSQSQNIRVYDPSGNYVRTIGRPGSGPGELGRGVGAIAVAAGDTLLVPDLQNLRINRYAPDGTSLASVPISLQRGLPAQFRVTPSGTILMQLRPLALPNMPAPDSMDAIVKLAASGEGTDTLMKFPSGRALNLGGSSPEIRPFAAEPVWDVRDDMSVIYAVNDAYRISEFGEGGQLERVITLPYTRVAVSEKDKRVFMNLVERQVRAAGSPPEAMALVRSMVKFDDYIPAFAGMRAGADGTIWVQHMRSMADLSDEELEHVDLQEGLGSPDWDVFDRDGRYLGVVTMPARFQPLNVAGDLIYGVQRDELDVQYVVRLHIIRS